MKSKPVKLPDDSRKLKREAFGQDFVPLDEAIQLAIAEATRLAQDIARLERDFPIGFGSMAKELRTWVSD